MSARIRPAASVAFACVLVVFGASSAARPIDDWLGCWPCDVAAPCRTSALVHPLRDDGWYAKQAAALRVHRPQIEGAAAPAVIARILGRGDFVHCLAPRRPTPASAVAVDSLVDASGLVVTATATGVDPTLAACVAGVVAKLRFPARRGGEITVHTLIDVPAVP